MRFLKLKIGLLIVLGSLLLPGLATTQELFFAKLPAKIMANTYFRSTLIPSPITFDAFAVEGLTSEQTLTVYVEQQSYLLTREDDGADKNRLSNLVLNAPATAFRFELDNRQQAARTLIFHLYDTRAGASLEQKTLLAGEEVESGLNIISRRGWGADESLRIKENTADTQSQDTEASGEKKSSSATEKVKICNNLIDAYPEEFKYAKVVTSGADDQYYKWPLQYSSEIKKLVIHHTAEASLDNERDPKEIMRAIYYYHAISRGWGDIGYNFVIDRDGNIYEGRAGGDFVVGGHAYCYNIGTMGISLMGNFESEQPSKTQINALINLGQVLTMKYGIHPEGKDFFHGERLANILGHRDVGATACPGDNLYGLFPYLRLSILNNTDYTPLNIQDANDSALAKKFAAQAPSDLKILDLKPTSTGKITFRFQNTGTEKWNAETWLFVYGNPQENVAVNTVHANYVAADLREKEVAPGAVASFEVEIKSGYQQGLYTFEFTPIVNGKYKVNKAAIVQPIAVSKPILSYQFVKMQKPATRVRYGEKINAWVELKNTGNVIWSNENGRWPGNNITLGTDQPRDRYSVFNKENPTRLAFLQQSEVPPGATGRFVFNLQAPFKSGSYREYFTPVINNVSWLADSKLQFITYVTEPSYQYQLSDAKQTKTTVIAGIATSVHLDLKNTGDLPWDAAVMGLEIFNPNPNLRIIDAADQEIKYLRLTDDVAVNKLAAFDFTVYATAKSNKINPIKLTLLYNQQKKFKVPVNMTITVNQPILRALRIDPATKIKNITLNAGDSVSFEVKFKNTGNIPWKNSGLGAIYLRSNKSPSRLVRANSWISPNTPARLNETQVAPNALGSFKITLGSDYRGVFTENFSVWKDGYGYVSGQPLTVIVKVFGAKDTERPAAENQIDTWENQQFPTTATTTSNPLIRVALSFQPAEAIIAADGYFSVTDLFHQPLYQHVKQDIRISIADTPTQSDEQKTAVGMRFIPEDKTILKIKNWEHRPEWNQELNDNEYRGILELRLGKDNILIINELPLEDYLQGVAEVSNNDPLEKQKTLAILARTYAAFYLQAENRKFPDAPYDANDDPAVFQKYLGYGYERRSPNFVKAVLETRGLVVTYNGQLVKTPYFNQSAGRTLSAEEVWGWTNTPYLISVPDPYCAGLERKGHGVGLSGYGATKMAEAGKNYEEIINYYYTGVAIEKLE